MGKILFLAFVSLSLYLNSLFCGFVFDDSSAILDNLDLRPKSPILQLFENDFWGTKMSREASHKSYRPLTVLTFRWNYAMGQLDPLGYHLVNIVLHTIVVLLFHKLCQSVLSSEGAFSASLIFAIHPVHVEAVTSIVGRAELLSAVFFLSTLLVYIFLLDGVSWMIDSFFLLCIDLLLIVGTLCKEQCITAVAVCLVYDFIKQIPSIILPHESKDLQKSTHKKEERILSKVSYRLNYKDLGQSTILLIHRLAFLAVGSSILLFMRFRIMGSTLPHFTVFDNPAAHAPDLSRRLTHFYLVFVNFGLLLYPSRLCADWTMGSIPLIESFFDYRNLLTLFTFSFLFILVISCLNPRTSNRKRLALSLGLSIMVLPFIPASNIFFYVGFVVAERVLYIPSLGFCILVGLGFELCVTSGCFVQKSRFRFWSRVAFFITCLLLSAKTFQRNFDWKDEYALFTSALRVNQANAKLWNNVGHSFEAKHEFSDALKFFQKAVEVQPDDMGARINVGRTLVSLGRFDEAEKAYSAALDYFPKPRKGETYHARVSPKDLSIFINLANLLSKDPDRLEEADKLLRRAISLREDFVNAYQNRGALLVQQKRYAEAEDMYRKALKYQSKNSALHYNLGVVFMETNRTEMAYKSFDLALYYDPEHDQTKFALASSYSDSKVAHLRSKAKVLFEELAARNFEPVHVHFALALIYSDESNFSAASEHYQTVLQEEPTHRSSLFNLALMYYNELQKPLLAIPLLEKLIEVHPSHTKSYLLLGDIELSFRKNAFAAQKFFEKAVELAPDNLQTRHNLCIAIVEGGNLAAGEKCLVEASHLAPNSDHYIFKHLSIVRKRMQTASLIEEDDEDDDY